MATNTGFKQQCPHCEARVPVKDESLIGEEINCPKCKKPFVVEDPEDAASAEAESKRRPKKAPKEREDDEEQPSKEKDKKKSKLVLGLALAGVAVVLLGVAAFFMLGSSDSKPDTASSGGGAPRAGGAAPAQQAPKAAAAPAQPVAGTAPGAVAGIIQANPTNLLLNDSEIVLNLQMKELLANRFGKMLFDPHGSESHSFSAAYGIPVQDIDRILSTGNLTEGWSFVIFRTSKGIKFESVKKALHLHEPELPIQGQEYFLTSFNWLPPESPIKVGDSGSATTTEAPGTRPLAVRLVDSQTLAMGDVAPMKNFLGVKGQPQNVKQPAGASPPANAAPPTPTPAPAASPGGKGRGPAQASAQSLPDSPPEARMLQGRAPAGAAPAQPAGVGVPVASTSYMTIRPELKAMLDRMELRPPVLFSFAFDAEADNRDAVGVNTFGFNVDLRTVGLSLHMKDKNVGLLGFECKTDAAAKELQRTLDTDLRGLTEALRSVGLEVEFVSSGGGGLAAIRGRTAGPGGPVPGGRGAPRGAAPPPGGPANPPGTGGATVSAPRNVSTARFTLTQQGANVQVAAEVQTDARVLERIADEVEPYLVRAQGVLEMTTAHPHPNQLGLPVRLYREGRAQFPRGTLRRKPSPARMNRDWPPDQRVSWMADLLPFLGYEGTHTRIKADKSWQDKDNIVPAVSLVAPFLDGRSHERDWYVRYPRMDHDVAATHFVGVAGIGLGAAEYARGDLAVAKKLGIFGYDRETRASDIVDGLANTIMMLQVPRAFKSPWMAGGGSTIRGVPETQCVKPFVSTEYEGKRGTYAVMADGSVRFVSENISDEVFRALCTINGEEPKLNLDKLAPVVPPPADDLPVQKAQLDAARPVK
jgi:flagellar basal body-associated protein FliL